MDLIRSCVCVCELLALGALVLWSCEDVFCLAI